jgi:hypothetical protein
VGVFARANHIHVDQYASLQVIADWIGALNGGFRDIVDLHTEARTDRFASARGANVQALAVAARVMLVKRLSYLAVGCCCLVEGSDSAGKFRKVPKRGR